MVTLPVIRRERFHPSNYPAKCNRTARAGPFLSWHVTVPSAAELLPAATGYVPSRRTMEEVAPNSAESTLAEGELE